MRTFRENMCTSACFWETTSCQGDDARQYAIAGAMVTAEHGLDIGGISPLSPSNGLLNWENTRNWLILIDQEYLTDIWGSEIWDNMRQPNLVIDGGYVGHWRTNKHMGMTKNSSTWAWLGMTQNSKTPQRTVFTLQQKSPFPKVATQEFDGTYLFGSQCVCIFLTYSV